MAKLKMIKMPKAPKSTASVATKERYLKRLAEVKAENKKRAALNRKSEELSKRIQAARAAFRK